MRPYGVGTNLSGDVIPDSGHWIAEERPDYLVEQLLKFFGEIQ
jgi:pimeloyl-ACP methyl ester carboxylesterase